MSSPTQHFRNLRAPLRNPRWSWGAQHFGGAIIFRAWDDEIQEIDGKRHIRLTNNRVYAGGPHPGYRERMRQIQQVRQGADGYVVICTARMPLESNRRIKSFDDRSLVRVTTIRDHGGDQWAELGESVPVEHFAE